MVTIMTLPDIIGWEEVTFKPIRPRWTERMEGRRTETQIHATSWWVARYVPGYLSWRDMGIMDAFLVSAGDDGEVFLGYDVFRPRPILEDKGKPLSGVRAGGGVFDGKAQISSIIDSRTVRVSGLPAGFRLSRGDYVEFRNGDQYSLHLIVADVVASSGGIATLSIKFGLDTQNFPSTSIVNFEKPSCLMQIDAGSNDGSKSWKSRRPAFSATEVFIS